MTLQIANGFNAPIVNNQMMIDSASLKASFEPPAQGRLLAKEDVEHLLNNPGFWMYQTMQTDSLVLIEQELNSRVVGSLTLEFLTSLAVLAFRVTASSVKPVRSMGRVVLVDYTPWQQTDPPVPLLNLLGLPPRAVALHNAAISLLLSAQDASAVQEAMRVVLQSGVDAKMHIAEAFYYTAKMLSLVTGAYSQRYENKQP